MDFNIEEFAGFLVAITVLGASVIVLSDLGIFDVIVRMIEGVS